MRIGVSVVMPAWNAERTIANAINSILNQTFLDWELIIVDDGSEDNTLRVVNQFLGDMRIRVIKKVHTGLVDSRNRGIQETKADIILTQDADDLSMPDRIEKCLEAIRGKDIVYHGAYLNMWDKQNNCIGRKYLPAKPFNRHQLLQGQYINGWPMFRKHVWQKKPFRMETQFAYDWMQYIDWAFSGFTFKALDVGLYEYVRHENSASIQFEKDGRRQQSFEKIKEIMKNEYAQS